MPTGDLYWGPCPCLDSETSECSLCRGLGRIPRCVFHGGRSNCECVTEHIEHSGLTGAQELAEALRKVS